MKAFDNGCLFSVTISKKDVIDFKKRCPCSNLPEKSIWAQFDKRNGDLIDLTPNLSSADGSAAQAIIDDGKEFAMKKLDIKLD